MGNFSSQVDYILDEARSLLFSDILPQINEIINKYEDVVDIITSPDNIKDIYHIIRQLYQDIEIYASYIDRICSKLFLRCRPYQKRLKSIHKAL